MTKFGLNNRQCQRYGSVRGENIVHSKMPRLCIANKHLPEDLQTCPCASKPTRTVLVSEQLVLPAGHSSGAERKNKKKRSNSNNPSHFTAKAQGTVKLPYRALPSYFKTFLISVTNLLKQMLTSK